MGEGLLSSAARAPLAAAALGLVIVWFAGGGGSSIGLTKALGVEPDYALNHNITALAMHQVNHPRTIHLAEDARAPDPATLGGRRPVDVFWASPDCTHHSKARGSAPVSERIRGLCWVVVDWARLRKPRVIFLENVEEFRKYGPLYPEGHELEGRPIPEQEGEYFAQFQAEIEAEGYQVEFRELIAADYDGGLLPAAPTTRKRLYMVARCDGEPIVWPKQTRAQRKGYGLKARRGAYEAIDFSIVCPSIFVTQKEAKLLGYKVKRPLVAATQRRIARGIERYVVGSAEPFIIEITNGTWGDDRARPVGHPLRTVTAAKGGQFAVVAPTIVGCGGRRAQSEPVEPRSPYPTVTAKNDACVMGAYLVPRYGERPGQEPRVRSVEDAAPAVVPDGNGGSLVAVHLHQANTRDVGAAAEDPVRTHTGRAHQGVVAATLIRQFGTSTAKDIAAPAPTVMPGRAAGGKTGLVAVSLTSYYATGVGSDMADPVRTATGEDRHAVTAAWLEQANTGMVGRAATEPVSTLVGKGCTQRVVEARLEAIGAPEGARRRAVLDFLWAHFGEPTEAEWADPLATLQGRLRFGLVVIKGQVFEIADIGLRMLTPRELFNAQGFPPDYIIDRTLDGRKITGTAATLMAGNSVCPPMAEALARANCGWRIREPDRRAA
jgi:DNA (cytosine-5)-methyltransferase 1